MAKNKDKSGKEKPTKSSKPTKSGAQASTFALTASSQAIDPSLASLFGSSLGPVTAPQRTYTPFVAKKTTVEKDEDNDDTATLDEESLEEDGAFSADDSEAKEVLQPRSKSSFTKSTVKPQPEHERRVKRKRAEDDLEERYMQRLQEEEDVENRKLEEVRKAKEQGSKKLEVMAAENSGAEENSDEDSEHGSENASEDSSESQSEDEQDGKQEKKKDNRSSIGTGESPESFPIRHETLGPQKREDLDEAARTVFLGNVPSVVISSKSSYKTLKSVFSAPGKILKLRFRSIAFSEQIPRKAAFATHKLHEKQQTVNAYVVYQTKEAAREALKLNGSVVLDRHIRADSVAHPAKHDTQRSVFIGNLDFEAQEESLWRHFAPCGKIEYVRVVRDGATNVGKGFAYVQFEDVVSVEQALLLDGQKMQNDRKLRVSRAKNIKRKNKPADLTRGPPSKKQKVFVPKDDPRQKEMLGRARRLLGKAGAAKAKKAPEAFIFEGTRATATTNPGVKVGGKKKGKPARASANARSSAWKQKTKK